MQFLDSSIWQQLHTTHKLNAKEEDVIKRDDSLTFTPPCTTPTVWLVHLRKSCSVCLARTDSPSICIPSFNLSLAHNRPSTTIFESPTALEADTYAKPRFAAFWNILNWITVLRPTVTKQFKAAQDPHKWNYDSLIHALTSFKPINSVYIYITSLTTSDVDFIANQSHSKILPRRVERHRVISVHYNTIKIGKKEFKMI